MSEIKGSPKLKKKFADTKSFYFTYAHADSEKNKMKRVFRGRYSMAMASSLDSHLKNTRVAALAKFFESYTKSDNLTRMQELGGSASCPAIDKAVVLGKSLQRSPSQPSFFSGLPKKILAKLSPCASPKSKASSSKMTNSKSPRKNTPSKRTLLVSAIMNRKSIGMVNTPIKSVKEIRKNFSPAKPLQ